MSDEPEDRSFGLPVELILLFAFLAISIVVFLLLTPQLSGSWIESLFNVFGSIVKIVGVGG